MDKRRSGILMHITSLPNKYGIGCFSKEAYDFIDFMYEAGFTIWQVLPFNVTSFGDSPYQSPSSAGLNYYFIDLETLLNKGLLTKAELKEYKEKLDENGQERVPYGFLYVNRIPLLRKAFSRFNQEDENYQKFKNQEKYLSFAAFLTLKEQNNQDIWSNWKIKIDSFDADFIAEIERENPDTFNFYLWTQFEFLNEYLPLKEYANSKGIMIMGDLPIYVAYDSVDVLAHQNLFLLNEDKSPSKVAGCPPDMFSLDGQLWGNPLYNWEEHKKENYKWWNERIKGCLELFDLLRIDHFRGFSAFYSIPGKDKTARNGEWVKGPGFDLFKDKKDLPIIAEDLGMLDADFYRFFDECGYPGMKIIHQCFDYEGRDGGWRPSNYSWNYFSYTSTHDSSTLKQYMDELDRKRFAMLKRILKDECSLLELEYLDTDCKVYLCEKTIETGFASKAQVAMTPMQDLLVLGKEARMNYPSSISISNWSWRLNEKKFKKERDFLIKKYKEMNEKFGR